MMKKRNQAKTKLTMSRTLLKQLVKDITSLMDSEEGYLAALGLVEQLPLDLQHYFIEKLSSIHEPKLATFFWLIADEYTGEVRKAALRSLEKLKMIGFDIQAGRIERNLSLNNFYKAIVTKSRFSGQVSLTIAWEKSNGSLDVQYFLLNFYYEGIKDYFKVYGISKSQFLKELQQANVGYESLAMNEAIYLLQQAHQFNVHFGTKPANGVFQYRLLLEHPAGLTDEEGSRLSFRLAQKEMGPLQTVNAFFIGFRNLDWSMLYDLLASDAPGRTLTRKEFISKNMASYELENYNFLQTKLTELQITNNSAFISASLVLDDPSDNLLKISYQFNLVQEPEGWRIKNYCETGRTFLDETDDDNPLNFSVYCNVYSIQDCRKVQLFFDGADKFELSGEFSLGLNYKWYHFPDPLDYGIDVTEMVFGEVILTEDELIVFAKHKKQLAEITKFMESGQLQPLIVLKQRYRLPVSFVYTIFSGDYSLFEEVYEDLLDELPSGDGIVADFEQENQLDLGPDQDKWGFINNWLQTKISDLQGMSPLEAKQTIEGKRLLWRLFKKMREIQQSSLRRGQYHYIDYREYIRAVGLDQED